MNPSPKLVKTRESKANRQGSAVTQFNQGFRERFRPRLHMTLVLSGVFVSGLYTSKLLLVFGVRSMLVRYLIAVCVSYIIFFFLFRVLLRYVTGSTGLKARLPDPDPCDVVDFAQIPFEPIQGSVPGPGEALNGPFGGGGDFGGGGATNVWGDSQNASTSVHSSGASVTAGSRGHTGGGGFDFGDEAIVVIALAILVFVIFGAGAYLVYAAPDIISEAAFQALLTAGLIKGSATVTRRGRMGSVLRATCVPFLVVLLMTGIFGWVAHRHYPHATRLTDIFKSSADKDR